MLCVIAFCSKDRLAAIRLLNWIAELDGAQGNPKLLLVAQHGISKDETDAVISAGRTAFEKVWFKQRIHPDDEPLGRRQSNWMFREALAFIRTTKELNCPFFWCEPDCVPLKTGWLDAIEKEYTACGKPFMGAFVPDPIPHMNGIAVYPPNVYNFNMDMAMADRTAWDLSDPQTTMGQARNTGLIQHVWSLEGRTGPPVHFEDKESLQMIRPEAVVFHRCNDGSLIDRLRGKPEKPSSKILANFKKIFQSEPEVTVVITSHQRPKHLLAAFDSCLKAGVTRIIITATGDGSIMRNAFSDISSSKPDAVIIFNGSTITSNQSWIVGIEAAKSQYVSILHDDDLLLPNFGGLVSRAISENPSFVMLQARNHGIADHVYKNSIKPGVESTGVLRPILEGEGNLAISPVRGVFLREDLIAWLGACEKMPDSCYLRPGFLVGNDLLIWLNAIDKYPHFYNVPQPGVSFGHWEGSTTVAEIKSKSRRIYDIYDEARRWYWSTKPRKEEPAIHIFTIVLDGMPFISQHLPVFNRLSIPWMWHIVEGAAHNANCTKWCKPQKPRLSKDGTTEYLDHISTHPRIKIYRKPIWNGKVEMVNAPLPHIQNECVLMEVDCDEFWTSEQIEAVVKLFESDASKTHAMFWCRVFFGPGLIMASRNCYSNNPYIEWKRAWRFKPGAKFVTHEPPLLTGESNAFAHDETESHGLVFDHYSYALRKQLEFKEKFYGYKDAVEQWVKLQNCSEDRIVLSKYLSWVKDSTAIAKRV